MLGVEARRADSPQAATGGRAGTTQRRRDREVPRLEPQPGMGRWRCFSPRGGSGCVASEEDPALQTDPSWGERAGAGKAAGLSVTRPVPAATPQGTGPRAALTRAHPPSPMHSAPGLRTGAARCLVTGRPGQHERGKVGSWVGRTGRKIALGGVRGPGSRTLVHRATRGRSCSLLCPPKPGDSLTRVPPCCAELDLDHSLKTAPVGPKLCGERGVFGDVET